jgi:hypothetical protein
MRVRHCTNPLTHPENLMDRKHFFSHPDVPGKTFVALVQYDEDSGPPWEQCDGHGPVRCVAARYQRVAKRPGERVLHQDRHRAYLYDWQTATKQARKDGWDAAPHGAPGRIERAVQADFDRLRGWLADDWHYVGVSVRMLGPDGTPVQATGAYDYALWGIESDAEGYILETAMELAHECACAQGQTTAQRADHWRAALKEAREVRYWAP